MLAISSFKYLIILENLFRNGRHSGENNRAFISNNRAFSDDDRVEIRALAYFGGQRCDGV